MRKLIHNIFYWIFKDEITTIMNLVDEQTKLVNEISEYPINIKGIENALSDMKFIRENCDVAVDFGDEEKATKSWAVISLHGRQHSFVKFVEFLNDDQMMEVGRLIQMYANVNTPKPQEKLIFNPEYVGL